MHLDLKMKKAASPWREWRGLVSAFIWFFCSMYSFYERLSESDWIVFTFMLLLCGALLALSLLFSRSPDKIAKIAWFTTPAGAACTALVPYAPQALCVLLFWLSAVLMAPLLCRRITGVVATARPGFRYRLYTLAVTVTIVMKLLWDGDVLVMLNLLPEFPFDVKFPILSAFALLGLLGIGAALPVRTQAAEPPPVNLKPSVRMLQYAAAVFLLFALNVFNSLVHTHIVLGAWESNDLFLVAAGTLLPAAGFFLYACFGDARREKLGFVVAMTLILLGCVVALLPVGSVLLLPMIVADELGATALEYYLLTMPLMYFDRARRPVLAASLGLAVYVFVYAIVYIGNYWIPPVLAAETMTRPLVIFGAVCVILLIPLVFSLWERQKEQMQASELMAYAQSKLNTPPPVGQSAVAVDMAARYRLTSREAEVLYELLQGRSNPEIAAALFVVEATVKFHVRNILRKAGAANRSELIAMMDRDHF